jgi:thiol-disulfide isomerase/thioredoxin
VVLLDFWATWCDPCIAEMPHLQRLYEELRERGFVILAISMDGPETVAAVPTFVRQHGLTFPVLLDSETRVTNIYNPKLTAPLAILLDRNRRQARVRQGYVAGDELRLEEDVRGLVLHGRLP